MDSASEAEVKGVGEPEHLAARLRGGSEGEQLLALQRLHEVAGQAEPGWLHAELRAHSVLELLFKLVLGHTNLKLRQEALLQLWSLSADPANAALLVEMPIGALLQLLPTCQQRGNATPARPQPDDTGVSEASRVRALAPALLAMLRNISLLADALPKLVKAGAVGTLLRLLLSAELEGRPLLDLLLVLWRLSASPEHQGGKGGAAEGGRRSPGEINLHGTADADLMARAGREMCSDSVLARIAAIALRTALTAEATAAERQRRPGRPLLAAQDEVEPSTANAAVSALLCNLVATEDAAARAGQLGAIESACWSLRASSAPASAGDAGARSGQLHAVCALANLLALCAANCAQFLEEEAASLPVLAELLASDEEPLRPAARARYKALVVVRSAAREAARQARGTAPLRVPMLVPRLVRLLTLQEMGATHSLALHALADLAGGSELGAAPGDAAASEPSDREDPLAGAREVVAAGALERLRSTQLSADSEVLHASLRLLCALTPLPEVAAQLAREATGEGAPVDGAPPLLDALLALLASSACASQPARLAVRVVHALLVGVPSLRVALGARPEVVAALVRHTESMDADAQQRADSAVHMVARASEAGAQAVASCGGSPALLEVLAEPASAPAAR